MTIILRKIAMRIMTITIIIILIMIAITAMVLVSHHMTTTTTTTATAATTRTTKLLYWDYRVYSYDCCHQQFYHCRRLPHYYYHHHHRPVCHNHYIIIVIVYFNRIYRRLLLRKCITNISFPSCSVLSVDHLIMSFTVLVVVTTRATLSMSIAFIRFNCCLNRFRPLCYVGRWTLMMIVPKTTSPIHPM
jgi:hypothetical protein